MYQFGFGKNSFFRKGGRCFPSYYKLIIISFCADILAILIYVRSKDGRNIYMASSIIFRVIALTKFSLKADLKEIKPDLKSNLPFIVVVRTAQHKQVLPSAS